MEISVFGMGCQKCHDVERMIRDMVNERGMAATVRHVSDLAEMMKLGIMSTPAVAIDGRVVVTGRAPAREEVEAWLDGREHAAD